MNFVIISHGANFLGMTATENLLKALNYSGMNNSKIYIVHSNKSKQQIDHFVDYFNNTYENSFDMLHVLPFCNSFDGVDNIRITREPFAPISDGLFDLFNTEDSSLDSTNQNVSLLQHHEPILCWLMKYYLPHDKYLFLDHDCFIGETFFEKNAEILSTREDDLFKFHRHKNINEMSLTAPCFFVNTKEIYPNIKDICDFSWLRFIIGSFTLADHIGVDIELELHCEILRYISLSGAYDDTLYNIIKLIIKKNPDIANNFTIEPFKDFVHISWSCIDGLKAGIEIVDKDVIVNRVEKMFLLPKKEFFRYDYGSEYFSSYGYLIDLIGRNLDECVL